MGWNLSSDKELCDKCESMLWSHDDFPGCEDCGTHTAHACLVCAKWWDDVWPEDKHDVDGAMKDLIIGN